MTTSPARLWTEALARLFCSYRLTPVGVPPVAHGPRAHRSISAATEVRRCAVEVVDDPRPSVEAVLAPAFPPRSPESVEVDGEACRTAAIRATRRSSL